MMVKRKLHGTVDGSSTGQEICKSSEKSEGLHLAKPGLTQADRQAGWQAVRQTKFGQSLKF